MGCTVPPKAILASSKTAHVVQGIRIIQSNTSFLLLKYTYIEGKEGDNNI